MDRGISKLEIPVVYNATGMTVGAVRRTFLTILLSHTATLLFLTKDN